MPEALIIDAVRTPIGKRGKALRDMHPVDLLGQHIAALLARTASIPPPSTT
jgi:acetyl-CoA acetyltransferase